MTVVSFGKIIKEAYKAADELEKEGIECEVIDLRTLRPIDYDTVLESVKKTNRLVILEEAWPFGNISTDISHKVQNEIFDFLVDRYGDFILLNPPFKPSTYVLWYGPLIFFIVGLLMTVLIMKKSKRRASEKPLSQAERVSLSKLLEQKDKT